MTCVKSSIERPQLQPYSYLKSGELAGGVVVLVILVASAFFASQLGFGSPQFIGACFLAGVSLIALMGVVLYSCCSSKALPQKHTPRAPFSPSSAQLPIPVKEEEKIEEPQQMQHASKPSMAPYIESAASHSLEKPLDWKSFYKRMCYHVLSNLLDSICTLVGDPKKRNSDSVIEKIDYLQFTLTKAKNFKFLKEKGQDELSQGAYELFQLLLRNIDPKANAKRLLLQFTKTLEKCYASQAYQDKLPTFYQLSHEEGKQQLPEMAFLTTVGFALYTQNGMHHLAEEAVFSHLKSLENSSTLSDMFKADEQAFASIFSSIKTPFSSKKAPFGCLQWQVHYSKEKQTPQIQYITLSGSSLPSTPLFLDYCAWKKLKVLAFQWEEVQHPQSSSLLKSLVLPWEIPTLNPLGNIPQWSQALAKHLLSLNTEIPSDHLQQLIHYVHRCFFKDKPQFEGDERQIFQLLVYAFLFEYRAQQTEVDFAYCEATENSDRKVLFSAVMYYLFLIRLGKEEHPHELRKLRVLLQQSYVEKGQPLGKEAFSLFKNVCSHLSSLTGDEKKALRQASLPMRLPVDIGIEENPLATYSKLPTETQLVEDYLTSLEEELTKPKQVFRIPNFVNAFFKYDRANTVTDDLGQFKGDLHRQLYLIDGQKLKLPTFPQKLSKKCSNKEDIDRVVLLEDPEVDQRTFVTEILKTFNDTTFLENVRECYHALRYEALQNKAFEWASTYHLNGEEILALSHQGVMDSTQGFLKKKYRFLPNSSLLDEAKLDQTIEVVPSFQQDKSSLCFNYRLKNGRPCIEVFQIYKIVQGQKQTPLYYIPTTTLIDLLSGEAIITCCPLQKDDPGEISLYVKKSSSL